MKIMVADDELPARQRLCRLLEELDYTDIVEASHGQQVLQQWQQQPCEVILLDIRMPGLDGLSVARQLSAEPNPPTLIFTTAYPDHALEAFEVYALDYLLKPIKKQRLQQVLERAQRLHSQPVAEVVAPLAEGTKAREYLCVRVRGNLQRIAVADIYYFRAEQKYVSVRHKNGYVLIEDALKALEQEFADSFIRVHRNALVANRYLQGMEKDREEHWFVTFKGFDERLEISRRHIPTIRKQFKLDA